ncbi:hypothetical protein K469DRAFT_710691 [Zopfia rhizophila CBS 207.26]|uniref:Uncharacterized protein n=1 Tax=Zopfia rhizophila CBS 207.26 TaxID=1314779 RepID=A0A6A6DV05_9PEZI|nr:hypothetical protein K469DRAFT_710691 [Zopfia rhizophila CBS 207.26]
MERYKQLNLHNISIRPTESPNTHSFLTVSAHSLNSSPSKLPFPSKTFSPATPPSFLIALTKSASGLNDNIGIFNSSLSTPPLMRNRSAKGTKSVIGRRCAWKYDVGRGYGIRHNTSKTSSCVGAPVGGEGCARAENMKSILDDSVRGRIVGVWPREAD